MDGKLYKKLSERQEKGTYRSLSSFEGYTDFFSNDYLGLGRDKRNFECAPGSTGSRLLSGNSTLHNHTEMQMAQFFESQAALHFNSGYDANLGVFGTLPQKGDTIIYDELIHASVRDGIRLSWAKSYSFRHNNLDHLRTRLEKAEGAVYIAIESLYSMDGDMAPLPEIVSLAKEYGAYVIVDEAHSGGIFGPQGKGIVVANKLEDDVFIRLITFGKAYGSHGAVVLSGNSVREYLINFCRPFIYSTALPSYVLEHNLHAIGFKECGNRREQLEEIIRYFRQGLETHSISDVESPIQIVEYGEVLKTKRVAEKLQDNRIAVKPIYSPTVPQGRERIRICLHAFNTKLEVDALLKTLNNLSRE